MGSDISIHEGDPKTSDDTIIIHKALQKKICKIRNHEAHYTLLLIKKILNMYTSIQYCLYGHLRNVGIQYIKRKTCQYYKEKRMFE
jgi:hypothetical protein